MISPEIIRRYPFFAGLSFSQIEFLAQNAEEALEEADAYFFHDGDRLESFYLVLEGEVSIVIELPDQTKKQTVAGQLTGDLTTKEVVVSTVGSGDVFGWSGMVEPHLATAGANAVTACRVVQFDCAALLAQFEEDCEFGFIMVQKAAQVIRDRLRDMRLESLAFLS